jgi:hypothetical protein
VVVAAGVGGHRVRRLGRRTELIELRAKVGELRTAERLLERELAEVKAERDRLLEMIVAERARVDQLLAVPAQRPRRWLWRRRGSGPFRGGAGMSPSPRDRQDLWYWAAVAGVLLVLLVIAWATGWFGNVAPPESAPVIPSATTQ